MKRARQDHQTNMSFVTDSEQTDEESLRRSMEMQSSEEAAKPKFTAYWMIGLSKPI